MKALTKVFFKHGSTVVLMSGLFDPGLSRGGDIVMADLLCNITIATIIMIGIASIITTCITTIIAIIIPNESACSEQVMSAYPSPARCGRGPDTDMCPCVQRKECDRTPSQGSLIFAIVRCIKHVAEAYSFKSPTCSMTALIS